MSAAELQTEPPLSFAALGRATPADLCARAVRPSWPLVILSAVILFAGCALGPFEYATWPEIAQRFGLVAMMLAGAALFAANDRPRTALTLEAFALTAATALTVPGLTSMIAALDVPYRDAELLAADRMLGFDWAAIVEATRAQPTLSIVMSHIYSSLLWQPAILLPMLAYADPERLRRVLAASTMALCFTVVVFVFVPAETGYVHLGYRRADFPDLLTNTSWGVAEILNGIRAGDRQLWLEGLITFPSYHAVAAALFAYAWMAVPVLRWPFVALNVIMVIACVPIGSHYVVDVIAGLIIAVVAYRAADRYYAKTDTLPPLAPWHETNEGRRILAGLERVKARLPWRAPRLRVPG
jgi:membrane-associated phospholipid phosphatase